MDFGSSPVLQINLPINLKLGDYLEGQISSAIAAQYGESCILPRSEPLSMALEKALLLNGYSVEWITFFFSSQRPEIDEDSCINVYLNGARNRVFLYRAWIDTQTEKRYFQREPMQVDLSFQYCGRDELFEKDWREAYSDNVENLAEKCFLLFRYGIRKYLIELKRCFSSN